MAKMAYLLRRLEVFLAISVIVNIYYLSLTLQAEKYKLISFEGRSQVGYLKLNASQESPCNSNSNIESKSLRLSGVGNAINFVKEEELVINKVSSGSSVQPLVCVVLTAYNVEQYLNKTLTSVITQTYPHLEIIAVNDASTDGTRTILDNFAKADSRIIPLHFFHNTFGGAGQPSNRGTERCSSQAKYVFFVDGDDYIETDAVEALVEKAVPESLDIAVADFQTFKETSPGKYEFKQSYDQWAFKVAAKDYEKNITEPTIWVNKISPVPWRMLYNRRFIDSNQVVFPEGDYFFEDVGHFFNLMLNVHKVGVLNKTIAFHRMGSKHQTMSSFSSNAQKWDDFSPAGFLMSYYYGAQILKTKNSYNKIFLEGLFEHFATSEWIISKRLQEKSSRKMKAMFGLTANMMVSATPKWFKPSKIFENFRRRMGKNIRKYELTFVIPCYHEKRNVIKLLDKILSVNASVHKYEVILVDDSPSFGLYDAIKNYTDTYENILYIGMKKSKGAGRARNMAIPIIEGEYAFFLDCDDDIDIGAMWNAVRFAKKKKSELVLLPYKLLMDGKQSGMFHLDQKIYSRRAGQHFGAGDKTEWVYWLKKEAFRTINYPWTKLVKTSLLKSRDIFFGATTVNNDVQFHWHVILEANSLSVFDQPVVTHVKAKSKNQLTNVNGRERMDLIDAIRFTDRVLRKGKFYKNNFNKPGSNMSQFWHEFIKDLLEWGEHRIPKECKALYHFRKKLIIEDLDRDGDLRSEEALNLPPLSVVHSCYQDQNTRMSQ